jgi:hypothetical protein
LLDLSAFGFQVSDPLVTRLEHRSFDSGGMSVASVDGRLDRGERLILYNGDRDRSLDFVSRGSLRKLLRLILTLSHDLLRLSLHHGINHDAVVGTGQILEMGIAVLFLLNTIDITVSGGDEITHVSDGNLYFCLG